ncbi:30S ribosomal protein S1, partial [Vibrio parahaemolyticus]
IKLDQKRHNVAVSRHNVIKSENSFERHERLETLQEGSEGNDTVKNPTDNRAPVALPGLNRLLHITDMAWERVKHPF